MPEEVPQVDAPFYLGEKQMQNLTVSPIIQNSITKTEIKVDFTLR